MLYFHYSTCGALCNHLSNSWAIVWLWFIHLWSTFVRFISVIHSRCPDSSTSRHMPTLTLHLIHLPQMFSCCALWKPQFTADSALRIRNCNLQWLLSRLIMQRFCHFKRQSRWNVTMHWLTVVIATVQIRTFVLAHSVWLFCTLANQHVNDMSPYFTLYSNAVIASHAVSSSI